MLTLRFDGTGCMRKACDLLYLLLLPVVAVGTAFAQSSASASPPSIVRYHAGDNPAWAGANFDDSTWPVAERGRWPAPPYQSDGFVWVRFRVAVRNDTAEPLGVRVTNPPNVLVADQVFVNGASVGSLGRVPPHAWVDCLPETAIFDLSRGLAPPGTIASVALRIWYPPFDRRSSGAINFGFDELAISVGRNTAALATATLAFDQQRTLHAEQEAASTHALLRNLPGLVLNSIILLIGCAVLLLGRSSRSRNLLLYGSMLATFPWITLFFEVVGAHLISLSVQEYFPLQVATQLPAMIVTVYFIWGINDLRDVWLKRLTLAAMWIFNLGMIVAYVPAHPSAFAALANPISSIALQCFNLITLGVLGWVLFILRRNRFIALAMTLPPLASSLVGFRLLFQQGQGFFDLAFFLAGLCLSIALAIEALKEWRTREALHTEFEAARAVQQRLITPAAEVPGFRIESVYAPAAQVGGDFFRVAPEQDGSVLVVVGDVSGKGLRAALTVSAIVGALRTMPPLTPARILAALNRGLIGQMRDGFVTCVAAHICPDGAVTLANAGHLSPYRNGEELPLSPGLPLGLSAEAEYAETVFRLGPNDSLTFLSDGVVEARDATGELFGFERAREISTQPAHTIAGAAQAFGQEDDITVLTLAYTGAGVELA
ncbi:MAG TPA: PP2C family protein-serine/threonine phosphatase [Terracidiphilus sp.]|nr:PP2C family protein-serine/threonine phosphatase [Terracidiphilus sp.]